MEERRKGKVRFTISEKQRLCGVDIKGKERDGEERARRRKNSVHTVEVR